MTDFLVKWIYKLPGNVLYHSGMTFKHNYIFKDKKPKPRMVITKDGRILIIKNYAWDGCTPKFLFWDLYFGTPEGAIHEDTLRPKTYFASLVHDALYQFYKKGRPYLLRDADRLFLKILEKYSFAPRIIYYLVVRILGLPVQKISNWKRKNEGTMEIVEDSDAVLIELLNQPHEETLFKEL